MTREQELDAMAQQPTTPAERLARIARILNAIEREQQQHPGYNADMAEAIIDGELRKLAEETTRAE